MQSERMRMFYDLSYGIKSHLNPIKSIKLDNAHTQETKKPGIRVRFDVAVATTRFFFFLWTAPYCS